MRIFLAVFRAENGREERSVDARWGARVAGVELDIFAKKKRLG
ncbi:hypothetical protein [Roseovarius indicus]|nr:hypothetical protein [Roseovarius indicus]